MRDQIAVYMSIIIYPSTVLITFRFFKISPADNQQTEAAQGQSSTIASCTKPWKLMPSACRNLKEVAAAWSTWRKMDGKVKLGLIQMENGSQTGKNHPTNGWKANVIETTK